MCFLIGFSSAPAAEKLSVQVDALKVRANQQAFSLQVENTGLDGLQCNFDFVITGQTMDEAKKKTTLNYQVTLPIAYQSRKTFYQDLQGHDLGQKVLPEKTIIKKVELQKQTCQVIAPLVTAQLHSGKRGFIYVIQNTYSGRDYICDMSFKMYFNHGIVSEVDILPRRVAHGQNLLESRARGVAYFNSHQAAFADLVLEKVEVSKVQCQAVPVQSRDD
ncbi:MAG: hypothetical protein J6Y94_01910 [Bacteriovoracaceae bacterium]|nr:hypothetical protein [Bacteriovoracaceae bacterium]